MRAIQINTKAIQMMTSKMAKAINTTMGQPIQNDVEHSNTCNIDDYKISIEDRSMEDPQITIKDISIIKEMNTSQINNNEINEEAIENNFEWTTVAINNRYNLRPRPANRGNMYTLLQNSQKSATMAIPKPHAHIMLTLMNIQEGIKRFGKKGNEALLKELNQLLQREALLPVSREDMSHDKKKKVLQYLMFLKEKVMAASRLEDVSMNIHRETIQKNETSLPMVSLEAIMLSCSNDAKEGRNVTVTEI